MTFRKTIAMNIADELRLVVSDSDSEAEFMETPAAVSASRG